MSITTSARAMPLLSSSGCTGRYTAARLRGGSDARARPGAVAMVAGMPGGERVRVLSRAVHVDDEPRLAGRRGGGELQGAVHAGHAVDGRGEHGKPGGDRGDEARAAEDGALHADSEARALQDQLKSRRPGTALTRAAGTTAGKARRRGAAGPPPRGQRRPAPPAPRAGSRPWSRAARRPCSVRPPPAP